MQTPHDYVVYVYLVAPKAPGRRGCIRDTMDMHAGESGDRAHHGLAAGAGPHWIGRNRNRERTRRGCICPTVVYTGIWWYARFPNHYSGDGITGDEGTGRVRHEGVGRRDRGRDPRGEGGQRVVKLQHQFYEDAKHPLETKQ